MNERVKVLFGALAALGLVVILLAPPAGREPPASRPTTEDRGRFGLMGLERWLERNGVRNASLRRRYTDLARVAAAPEGNLLISSLPHAVQARTRELDALLEWTERGNSVLLLTTAEDAPAWQWLGAVRYGEFDQDEILERFGFELEYPAPSETDTAGGAQDSGDEAADTDARLKTLADSLVHPERAPVALRPRYEHPRVEGLSAVASYSTLSEPAGVVLKGLSEENLALALLERADTGGAVFWEAAVGRGRLWVSAYPELFGNVTLGEVDNARFLTRLLQASLGMDGRVVFDDFHFGLSELYDPAAFFTDRRLHATLGFILVFWLAYVLGRSPRLAPPRPARSAPRESDFVEALAGLCARREKRHAVASGLAAHFFNELRRRHRRPENGRPAWDLLERHAGVPSADRHELRRLVSAAARGDRIRLTRFTHLLNTIRKKL